MFRPRPFVLLVALIAARSVAQGQCGVPIATFPYQEDFEAGPAWTAGGTSSDWAWGTPAHPTINSAGGGLNSWCVGGLTGSFYSLGQQSWLESPCFDFSNLQYPWISFQLFWEVERQYDGLVLQYSLNGGTTYQNVGAFGDPVDCLNDNWYNEDYVNNLSTANPRHGWSGRIGATVGSCSGGMGSAGWVTAKHCMTGLAGEPSVRFRFLFGAGTACNNYDGIGIDDVFIGEAPANAASFTYTCSGNQVTFQHTNTLCPTSYAWDFDDPASGAQNASTLAAPSHTFPGPGTYDVTFTVAGPCNAPSTVTVPVMILGVTITAVDPQCTPNSGSCTAVVTGGSAPYAYAWSPGGQGTAAITGLAAGTYDVTVSATGACAGTASATLVAPSAPVTLTLSATDVSCSGGTDGSASVTANGGVAPFDVLWSPGGQTSTAITNLAVGTYDVQVTDAAGCVVDTTVVIDEPAALVVTAMPDVAICNGSSLTLTASTSGGTGTATYAWNPAGPNVGPAVTTVYSVTATDANGCVSAPDQVTVTVGSAVVPAIDHTAPAGCAPWCVDFSSPTVAAQYDWDFGDGGNGQGAALAHCYAEAGTYDVTLTVTDAAGCTGTASLVGVIEVYPLPAAAFLSAPAVALVSDPSFTFTSMGGGASQFDWTFGDPAGSTATGPSTSFTYPGLGCYTVELLATSADGCTDRTEADVCVEDEYTFYAPNAFTPNGDAINDVFGVVTSVRQPSQYVLRVFDRWGGELWSTSDRNAVWTGETVEQGVYAWTLELRDATGELRKHRGHVLLLR